MRAVLVAGLLLLAGCVGGPELGPDEEAAAEQATLIVPAGDAARASAWHKDFVTTFTKRDTGSPTNWQAGQFLEAELEEMGWETQVIEYLPDGERAPTTMGQGINVIIGTREGTTDPESIIGWVSHYDTQTATTQGAYDDGSGVAAGIEVARMFSEWENEKTLMAIFFDSEEIGLVGSDHFVNEVVVGDQARWHLIIGHDMVGINWPGHEWPMYQMVGEPHAPQIVPVEERLYRDLLQYPEEGVVVLDEAYRNSDERRFKEAGVPVIRMAGGEFASDYPQYHQPNDTVDFMIDFAGGEEAWQAGLDTILTTTAWNIALFDQLPHADDPTFPVAAGALLDGLADGSVQVDDRTGAFANEAAPVTE